MKILKKNSFFPCSKMINQHLHSHFWKHVCLLFNNDLDQKDPYQAKLCALSFGISGENVKPSLAQKQEASAIISK